MRTAAAVLFGLLTLQAAAAPLADHEWSVYGGDAGGTKYSPLADIDRGNVGGLALAWSWRTGERPLPEFKTSPGMFEATPLMIDGVLYLSTPYNQVVALDAASGRERWRFDPGAYRLGQVPNGTGFVHRGVAAWRDPHGGQLRILMNSRGRLIELDARSGRPVESFGRHGSVDLLTGLQWPVDPARYTNTSPPVVYGDLVILGNGVADRLIYRHDPPGDVRAFDARTGRRVWTFHTVPRDGEAGVESWQDGAHRYTGHTNVWAPFTLDAQRGRVYLPVSTPSNDFYGGNRRGENLFGDSLVCLDARTGERLWHRQLVHHGLWDYDAPGPPALITLQRDGQRVDAVVLLSKQGFAFVFDRTTGEPLFPIEERPVPPSDVPGESAWPTQPFVTGLPPLGPQGVSSADATDLTPALHEQALRVLGAVRTGPLFTPPSTQGTVVRPGLDGGADWGGGAFDPATGVIYVKLNDDPSLVFPDRTDAHGNVPAAGPNDATDVSLYLDQVIPVLKPPYAYLDALDLTHGRMLWQRAFGDNPEVRHHPALAGVTLPSELGAIGDAGLLLTAGGLLFAGSGDRALHAVDKDTGKDLWVWPTGTDRITGTPMTYRRDGTQYVVVASGGPGEGATLLAFALGGHAAGPAATARPSGPLDVEQLCGECHSFATATRVHRTRAQWEVQIESMVAKGARIPREQFEAVAGYLTRHYGVHNEEQQ